MTEAQHPKFMKDADGFCYTWTPTLSKMKHLTPYDGDIKNGIAVADAPKDKVARPGPAKKKEAEAKGPVVETPPAEPDPVAADPAPAADVVEG